MWELVKFVRFRRRSRAGGFGAAARQPGNVISHAREMRLPETMVVGLGSSQVTVRPVGLSDARGVAALMTQLGYPTEPAEMRSRLERVSARTDYHGLVAELDGAVVGFAAAVEGVFFERNGSYGRIVALVVDESVRGMGVGRNLLSEVEEWAWSKGAEVILINSGFHRATAHAFYERAGYSRTGVRFVKERPPVGREGASATHG